MWYNGCMTLTPSQLRSARKYRRKIRALVNTIKEENPCVDCGNSYPFYIMDFHHRDPSTKSFTIGDTPRGKNLVLDEIAKCDVLCANCHRERDHREASGRFAARPT